MPWTILQIRNILIIIALQRSCKKVMFSVKYVCQSVSRLQREVSRVTTVDLFKLVHLGALPRQSPGPHRLTHMGTPTQALPLLQTCLHMYPWESGQLAFD